MGRPSGADLFAAQLQLASSARPPRSPTSPFSSPPSSSFLDTRDSAFYPSSEPPTPSTLRLGESAHSYSNRSAPLSPISPSAPWTPVEAKGSAAGTEQAPLPKLASRDAVAKGGEGEDEPTDDELEDELNDFGYGARPRKKKEKKESLLDILNSEPPPWVNQGPELNSLPIVVESPQRTGTFGSKFRSRFASNGPSSNSSNGASVSSDDLQANFSTLRPSRSAGNLLSSFRKPGGGGNSSKRSNIQQDKTSSDSTTDLLPSVNGTNRSNAGGTGDVDEFGSMSPPPPPRVRKLSTKPATAMSSSTRDLADFLRDSAPPPTFSSPSSTFNKENGSVSSLPYRNRSGSSKTSGTSTTSGIGYTHRQGRVSRSGSIDTSSSATTTVAGVKAAMARLGRRASLTPFSAAMMLSPPLASTASTTSLAPTPSEFSEKSEDGTGTIRVDQQLIDGLFGFAAKPLVMTPTSPTAVATPTALMGFGGGRRAGGGPLDVERELRAKEEEALSVRKFVAVDEKEGGILPKVTVAGEGPAAFLPGSTPRRPLVKTRQQSLQAMALVGGLVRSASGSSKSTSSHSPSHSPARPPPSPSQLVSPTSPRENRLPRKPVPSVISPDELMSSFSSSSSTSFSTRKPISDETMQSLLGLHGLSASPRPFSGLSSTAAHCPVSGVSSSAYTSPPLTPSFAYHPDRNGHSTAETSPSRGHESVVDSDKPSHRPSSPFAAAPVTVLSRSRPVSRAMSLNSMRASPPTRSRSCSFTHSTSGFNSASSLSPVLAARELEPSFPSVPSSTLPLHPSPSHTLPLPVERTLTSTKSFSVDAPLLHALDALRDCMRTTSELPINGLLPAPGQEELGRGELVEALVPTLEGLREQMELGARLVEEVLKRLRGGEEEVTAGGEEKKGKGRGKKHRLDVGDSFSSSEGTDAEQSSTAGTSETGDDVEKEALEEMEEMMRTPTSPDPPTITLSGLSSSSSSDGEGFSSFIKAYR